MKKIIFCITIIFLIQGTSYAQNVGIGTLNPKKKLDVEGSIKVADSLFVGSKVAVGVETPSSTLHIVHDASSGDSQGLRIENSVGNSGDSWWNLHSQGSSGDLFFYGGDDALNGTPHFTIENNGEVGIGSTNPRAKLHVVENGIENEKTIVGILESPISNKPTLLFSENTTSDINSGMSIEYNGFGSGDNNKMHINKTGGDPIFTIKNNGNMGLGTTDPLCQIELRRSDTETVKEQLRIWQGGTGDATLRFASGFIPFNSSFLMGIDGSDGKFKISTSETLNNGLDVNTLLEIDNTKITISKPLKNDFLAGNGTRNVVVDASGNILAATASLETYSVNLVAISQSFSSGETLEPMYLPNGSTIVECTFYYKDNDQGEQLSFSIKRKKHSSLSESTLCNFQTSVSGANPNIVSEQIAISNFNTVDNGTYSYFLDFTKFGSSTVIFPSSVFIVYQL